MLDVQSVVQPELLPNERLLWSGQPDRSVRFTAADIFLIPFSVMWGGFALFWEAAVLTTMLRSSPLAAFFALWGIPFVLMGLYFMVGRFWYKDWRKRRTYYAITDRRVLVLTKGRTISSKEMFIDTMPSITKRIGGNGIGTIRFGDSSLLGWMSSMCANTGMEFFASWHGNDVMAFYDVRDANTVYEIVRNLRSERKC